MTDRELLAGMGASIPYRRHVDGADFSLEANTEAVPERGHFYVLRGGKVELESDDFLEAMEAYRKLCRRYWARLLDSGDQRRRMAGAWGLVELEPDNKTAVAVIRNTGGPADRKRLEQIRRRKHAEAAHAARGSHRHR